MNHVFVCKRGAKIGLMVVALVVLVPSGASGCAGGETGNDTPSPLIMQHEGSIGEGDLGDYSLTVKVGR